MRTFPFRGLIEIRSISSRFHAGQGFSCPVSYSLDCRELKFSETTFRCAGFPETRLCDGAPSSLCLATPHNKSDREAHQMAEQQQAKKRSSGLFRLFERGVDTATRNNVTAMGYSITITAAFALLQTSRSDTGILAVFVFAAGAVVAFAIIAALASGFFREELEDQTSNVKAPAGAVSFLSVGLALGVAYVVGLLIPGLAAWPVSAFLATMVYMAAVGLELTIAHLK